MNPNSVYIRKNTDSGKFEIVQYYNVTSAPDKVILVLDDVRDGDCQYSAVDVIREGFRRR